MNNNVYPIHLSLEFKKEEIYQHAKKKIAYDTAKYLGEAIDLLSTIRGYKDADALIAECKIRITSLSVKKEKFRAAKKAVYRHHSPLGRAVALIVALLLICAIPVSVFVTTQTSVPRTVVNSIGVTQMRLSGLMLQVPAEIFSDCETLQAVEIQNGIRTIGYSAFYSCDNLLYVKIASSVVSIGDFAFANCKNLRQVTLGPSTIGIKETVFMNSPIESIYYEGDILQFAKSFPNGAPTSATVYFYSETNPDLDGHFWHYVDGAPTVWGN